MIQNPDLSQLKGVPKIGQFPSILETDLFHSMKNYSNEYLLRNKSELTNYKWVKDALNQWSRVFEYQYCFEKLRDIGSEPFSILDAGSGITFFPFFLSSVYNYSVTCIDDDNYTETYNSINTNQGSRVNFKQYSLDNVGFPDKSFDSIICVSVLEHTNNYERIIKEFYRLLKINGVLIVTFDISINNNSWGISKQESVGLLNVLSKYFKVDFTANQLEEALNKDDLYTTKYIYKIKEFGLLPFPKPSKLGILKNIILGKQKVDKFPDISFCCITAKKDK